MYKRQYLKSYAINGVSMTMDGAWNVHIEQGVAMRSDLYALLETTGLCCRNVNWLSLIHICYEEDIAPYARSVGGS